MMVGTSLATMGLTQCGFFGKNLKKTKLGIDEVNPVEDLMREHGALNRILLIYEEGLRRISSKEDLDPILIQKSANLIRNFIENYHEKLEEDYIFPRLKKAQKLSELVDILFEQHQIGRKVTDAIISLSTRVRMKNAEDLQSLKDSLSKFIRMYRPHEAREDTIVFPSFKTLLTQKEFDILGDNFEDKEHQLFGQDGFEGVVAQIAEIEKKMGIFDLQKWSLK